jgi:hypothetical protein
MGTGTTIVPKSGASSGVAMLPHHNRDIAIKSSESEEIEEAKWAPSSRGHMKLESATKLAAD